MNTALQHINSHVPKESRRMTTILKNTTAVNADGSMKTIVITDDPVPVELQDSVPIVTEYFTYDSVQLNADGTYTEPVKAPEEAELNQSLLQLPEVKTLIEFYHNTITSMKADKTKEPYLKKLKIKRLQNEYKQVVLWIQGVSRLMRQLETDPDNVQTQADINVIGTRFAERITKLVEQHHITTINTPIKITVQGD